MQEKLEKSLTGSIFFFFLAGSGVTDLLDDFSDFSSLESSLLEAAEAGLFFSAEASAMAESPEKN